MALQELEPLPPSVHRLRQRVQKWRQAKQGKFSTTPSEFWEVAVPLAMEYGVCRVARAAGLDYGGLRKRVAERSVESCTGSAVTFVEVPTCGIVRSQQVAPEVRQVPSPEFALVVDISRPDGARMRISLSPRIGTDAAGIVTAFAGTGA